MGYTGRFAAFLMLLGAIAGIDAKSRIIGGDLAEKERYPYFASLLVDICVFFPEYGYEYGYEYYENNSPYEYFGDNSTHEVFPVLKDGSKNSKVDSIVREAYAEAVKARHDGNFTGCPLYVRICGGTLVGKDSVLSAAHCFEDYGFTQLPHAVRIGDQGNSEIGENEIDVESFIIHPQNNGVEFDLMVLKLKETTDIEPVTLFLDEIDSSEGSDDLEKEATVIGFGFREDDEYDYEYYEYFAFIPHNLREVQVPLVSDEECIDDYSNYDGYEYDDYEYYEYNENATYEYSIGTGRRLHDNVTHEYGVNEYSSYEYSAFPPVNPDTMICAGKAGFGVCFGDSGGPLFFKGETSEDDLQFAVVSWGGPCGAEGFPAVYARLSVAEEFLKANVPDLKIFSDKEDIPILIIAYALIAIALSCFVVGFIVMYIFHKKKPTTNTVDAVEAKQADLEKNQAVELKVAKEIMY